MREKNVTIQDFINILGTPRNTHGSDIYFNCPKCKDETKPNQYKLGVNISKGTVFNCNKCLYSGNFINLNNDNNKTYSFSDTYKPVLAITYKAEEKKKIDTKALKVFYDFMTEKYLNDNETKTFCEQEYYKERKQIIPANVSFYKKYWVKEFILKHKEIALELNKHGLFFTDKDTKELVSNGYYEDYLLYFHAGLNDEIEHITPYLFKSLREGKKKKYPKPKGRFDKGKHNLSAPIVAYGNFTLNKLEYLDNLLVIDESIEKYHEWFLRGYSGLGLGGINQSKALIESLLPIKDKLILNKTKIIFSFDSKQNIFTKELEAIIKNSKELNKIGITNIYVVEVPKPEFLSDTKDNDINDFLLPLESQEQRNKALEKLIDKSLTLEKYLESKEIKETKKPSDTYKKKNFRFINYNGKKENYPSIKEIKENKKILKLIKSFLNETEHKQLFLLLKATAGTGKTTAIIELILEYALRLVYVAPNNALLKDFEQALIKNDIKYHIEKSFTELCKDTHELNNIDISDKNSIEYQKSHLKKVVDLVSRGYESKTACNNCPFRQTCKVINKQVPEADVKILLFTFDKFLLSQKMVKEFDSKILVIDESITELIQEETIIDEIELKKINDFYKDKSPALNTALKLLNFIIKDLPETKLHGKELYKHYEKHYTNFKKNLGKINVSEIEKIINSLELEKTNDINLLPNKKSLINFIKDMKTSKLKSTGYIEKSLRISSKKELDLSIFRNIINIDATASKDITKNIFKLDDTNIRFENIDAINPNLTIYQDYNVSWKATQLENNKNRKDYFLEFLMKQASDNPDKNILVITPLSIQNDLESEESLRKFNNITYKHHRELKGVNHLGNNDICIITDTKNNLEIMKLKCFALFGIVPKIIKRKVKTNVIENNRQLEIEIDCFDNPLCNEYLEQNRSAELYQCYKRIDRLGSDKKIVYYLGQNNLSEFTKESILPIDITVKNKLESIRLKKEYYELEKIVLDLIENFGVISYQILYNLFVKNEIKNEQENNIKVLKNNKKLLPLCTVNTSSCSSFYNIYTVARNTQANDSLIISNKILNSFLSEIIKNNNLISKKISILESGSYKTFLYFSDTKENLDIFEQDIKAFNSSQKLPAPTPAEKENNLSIPITEEIETNLDILEIENTKDILLTEIVKSFCNEELKKALSLNRTIDKQYFNWIERNCILDDGSYRNFTFFHQLKNDFINLSDNDVSTVLVMIHNFFIENRERFNNNRLEMKGFINMDNDSNDFKCKYTSKIIAEGDKRFNDFKYKRIKDLQLIDKEYIMKINAYLEKKNISDYELLVSEWVLKLILDEKEAINNEILFKLNNIPSNVIQINRNKSKCEKEYLYKLAEDIYYLVKKSNYDIYIDVENKCWSDYFKHVFNNGDEYNYMIKHISLKFSISSELSQKLFDYYPNQLQEFINLA